MNKFAFFSIRKELENFAEKIETEIKRVPCQRVATLKKANRSSLYKT